MDLRLKAVDTLIGLLNARPLRRLSERVLTTLLRHQGRLPVARLEALARTYLRTDTPCVSQHDSPHHRFVHWYLDRFGARTVDNARRYLREVEPARAAIRLDRMLRLALLAELRAAVWQRTPANKDSARVPLNQAQLALYPHCDLSCTGCYTQEERHGKAPQRDEIAWLVDEAAACGAHFIHVIGKGEPFLSPAWAEELLDVIDARPHLFFTIVTHGMRITPALAARLGTLGNVVILVSIDGTPEIHDERRGPGSYARVLSALALLRQHGVLFGFSTTVSARSSRAVATPEFVRALAAAGCSVGMYSRYFPLSPEQVDTLTMSPAARTEYVAAFARVRDGAAIPLLDLDDIEGHTGCHSRSGESVYIDGITGAVSPCLRVPFAPPQCHLHRATGRGLAEVLDHPFFVDYRRRTGPCPSWCGADLAGELAAVDKLLHAHSAAPTRLAAYRDRSPGADGLPRRRLPVLPS